MEGAGTTAPAGRVLLVDDDRVFGMWATKVLQARGYVVEHVLDPVNGLKHVEAEPWDLVITDVEMPRMTGLEFMERARRLDPDLPVAVVTGHPTVERAVTTMQRSSTEFITKPTTPEDFADKVAMLIAQRTHTPEPTEAVLAIGAHPGDVEMGAAGTLLAHQAAGVPVTILTLAAGEGAPGSPGLLEATRLSRDDIGGGELAIDDLIAEVQPTILYAHSVHDTQMLHRDANLTAMSAAGRIASVYCFQSPTATLDFRPGHFVSIGDYIDNKVSLVQEFGSLPEVREFLESDEITSTARYWARYGGAPLVEAFEVVRASATSAPTATARAAS